MASLLQVHKTLPPPPFLISLLVREDPRMEATMEDDIRAERFPPAAYLA